MNGTITAAARMSRPTLTRPPHVTRWSLASSGASTPAASATALRNASMSSLARRTAAPQLPGQRRSLEVGQEPGELLGVQGAAGAGDGALRPQQQREHREELRVVDPHQLVRRRRHGVREVRQRDRAVTAQRERLRAEVEVGDAGSVQRAHGLPGGGRGRVVERAAPGRPRGARRRAPAPAPRPPRPGARRSPRARRARRCVSASSVASVSRSSPGRRAPANEAPPSR